MRRITGANAPGGLFRAGATPAESTIVTADWLNDVQETILHTIEAAGLTPGADPGQLTDAIAILAPEGGGGGGGGETVIGAYQLSDDLTGPVVPTTIADNLVLVATMTGLSLFLSGVSTAAVQVRLRHMRAGSSLADIVATIAIGQRAGTANFSPARTITAGDYFSIELVDAGSGGLGLKAKVRGTAA